MKEILGIVVLSLLWCNVGFASGAGGIRESGNDQKCFELFEKEKIFEKKFLPRMSNRAHVKGILVTYVGCNKDYDDWGWWDSTRLDLDTAHAQAYRGCVNNQFKKYKLTGCHLFSIDDVIVWGKDDTFIKKIEKDAIFANFVARLQLGKGATFANYVAKLDYLFVAALFTNEDIINEKDPTTFQNIVFVKKKTIKWWDRRGASGGYAAARQITFKAFIFKATFLKGRRDITIRVNAEFETENKAKEQAIKYAKIIGQLPNFLTTKNLKTLTIHKGNEKWGGGNNDILIHASNEDYRKSSFEEEVAIHEAGHATLDPQWHGSIKRSKWNKAMKADNKFVSPYAKRFPTREDIAETINWWIAVRCKSDRISKLTYEKIILGIPNRLKYLDEQNYDTYPLVCK